ncbi:MAG: magnesium-dependent phosphatase-1 [Armatimonadota bacterium]|nr:magnesium-dependent phosphatase-1 [Armatimonadota bacterium]MDR7427728.1 magnesium-dependent phosphatase-1 [Armatimonadota bacterium]MDR7464635.1 magnesium-dependent phosphatase-1 [Armatimonadota bacterium]MDR7469639.1 magnesium-dependent phosphatase-1 [Armatimonadota bacterium]MDR7474930.1 magnesium-dependent phosphatase-1 [Armatimonadota bacterium]
MAVKLVIFDLDRTLWDHANVSALVLPVHRVDEETVEDAAGTRVRLHPGARQVLEELHRRGVVLSIASWNQPEPVFAVLEALGLREYFLLPRVEPHPYKERTIPELLSDLSARGLALHPREVLYVDDRALHLRRVRAALPEIHTLQPGVEITALAEVLAFVDREAGA